MSEDETVHEIRDGDLKVVLKLKHDQTQEGVTHSITILRFNDALDQWELFDTFSLRACRLFLSATLWCVKQYGKTREKNTS